MTLLATLAARAIALPLSPGFPAAELQYILNQSGASLLVSSAKFSKKANEVLATELDSKPTHLHLEKHLGGSAHEQVVLENEDAGQAAMMLYTSGTTNRPVCRTFFHLLPFVAMPGPPNLWCRKESSSPSLP